MESRVESSTQPSRRLGFWCGEVEDFSTQLDSSPSLLPTDVANAQNLNSFKNKIDVLFEDIMYKTNLGLYKFQVF